MALWSLKDQSFLIIDDFAEMRTLLRGMLTALGAVDIVQARDGDEAIEVLRGRSFEAVLCDYNLGDGQDGQQVLEQARIEKLLPRSSLFIMVTAENTYEMVMGAVEFEPDAYLSKPVTKTVMQSRLRKLFERQARISPVTCRIDSGQLAEALEECDRLLAENGTYQGDLTKLKTDLLMRLERYEDAESTCANLLESRPVPWAMLALGNARFELGRWGRALGDFEALAAVSPSCVAAYDGMAKVQHALGDDAKAQEALSEGVRRSPKSLSRQRMLGHVAAANEDWKACEHARRQAVRIGKHSSFKAAEDYTGLAEVLLRKDAKKEALKTVQAIRYVFRGDDIAEMQGAVSESGIQTAMNNAAAARSARDRAREIAARSPAAIPSEVALELIASSLAVGESEEVEGLVSELVRNHHDESELLAQLQAHYAGAGMAAKGAALIGAAKASAVDINNRAVALAEHGDLDESCALFEQAVGSMPGNCVINLNAAQSTVMWMRKHGVDHGRVQKVLGYLEVARTQPQYREKYRRVREMLVNVASA